MRARHLLTLPLALLATLLLGGVALAGGWATATLDVPPDDPSAGEPVPIGFTVMQHGVTPAAWGEATLTTINAETGERTSYAATASGPPGHWVAEVIFPATGAYTFEIRHDLEIASVNVAETTVQVRAVGPTTTGGPAIAYAALAGAAALLVMVALWLAGGRRATRSRAAAPAKA